MAQHPVLTLSKRGEPNPARTLLQGVRLQEFARLTWAETSTPEIFEKVERAKREWEASVDTLPELVCLLDSQGRILPRKPDRRALGPWTGHEGPGPRPP